MAVNFAELARSGTHSILIAYGIPVRADGPSVDAMAGLAVKHDWHIGISHDATGWHAHVRDALDRTAIRSWAGSGQSEADAIGQAMAHALTAASSNFHA
jgi:hypothetical protein